MTYDILFGTIAEGLAIFFSIYTVGKMCFVCVLRFVSKSAPLHKSYVCFFCKNSIKPMQKFVKCSRKLLFCLHGLSS